MKKLLLLAVLLVGLYMGGRLFIAWREPNTESTARVNFEIPRGASLKTIAATLYEKELIRDKWAFEMYVRYHRLGRKLQAGEYVVQRNLTFEEMVQILQNGRSSEIKITIPEGFTISQIDERLAKLGLIEQGAFAYCAAHCVFSFSSESLEGYLFPSTYYVAVDGFTSKKFIEQLYATFQQQLKPYRTDIANSERTLDEIVIVASMVEREAITDDEMPQIADVIWKRLDDGMPLGIDATTRYELNDWKRALYAEDFEGDSPYNTRRNAGLPPTAISNPGIRAFAAAINPETNDYYYYLHDSSGRVHFARTHDEHVQNKNQYLY